MNVSRRTEANYPWIAGIDWKNMKIFRKRSTCPSIPVSCPNCANTCSRRPSSLVGKGGHAGQGGRRYRNGTRRKGAPGAEYSLYLSDTRWVSALSGTEPLDREEGELFRCTMRRDGRKWKPMAGCGGGCRDSGPEQCSTNRRNSLHLASGEGGVSFRLWCARSKRGWTDSRPLAARIDVCAFAGETWEERSIAKRWREITICKF